jgi:hypothetical protein
MSAPKKFKSTFTSPTTYSLSSDSDDNIFITDVQPTQTPWLKRKAKGQKYETHSVTSCSKGPPQMVVTPKMCRNYKTKNDTSASSPDSKGDFIDLSHDSGEALLLPGAPFNWLRKRHELFWSYDPRGHEPKKDLDSRYCQHCRCPEHYCAQIMYGDVCTNHTRYMIVEMGGGQRLSEFFITNTFAKTYTQLVQCKMMENGVSFPGGFQFKENMDLPACLVKGSLEELIEDYE